jgi:3-phosphoshikimate 1-carboxyvinyltransferase
MSTLRVRGGTPLRGRCRVPGDKSISHRALLFGALAEGDTHVRGFLDGGDCRATLGVIEALGIVVERISETELIVHGRGLDGLQAPSAPLDCVNSGTTMRLLAGILAGQRFPSAVVGSEQLQRRPMKRVTDPLAQMGAEIETREGGLAPLEIEPRPLRGIQYQMPVASAQVKSCVLLAGLYADGETEVFEPGPARDHTERMLLAMGAPLSTGMSRISIRRPTRPLRALTVDVPGDPSSAAFLLVAGSLVPESELTIEGVGTNPTRTGLLTSLTEMGAAIALSGTREPAGEPIADLLVRASPLQGSTFEGDRIVTMIDEIPLLAVAATQAVGRTEIHDAAELRVKETDRIATTVEELRKLGAKVEALDDGLIVEGPTPLRGATVNSHGDHRLAMALTVAGLLAGGTTEVEDAACSADSFPGFVQLLGELGADLQERDTCSSA